MFIILDSAEALKRVLQDGTEEQQDGAKNVSWIFRNKYGSRGVWMKVVKVAWFGFVDSWDDYFELPLLEEQDELFNPPRILAC